MPNSSRTINKNCQLSTARLASRAKRVNCQLSKPGFSLIDVLLTMFLVVMFSSILLVGSGSYLTSRKSTLRTLAAKIASEQIDRLRNQAKTNFPYVQGDPPCYAIDPAESSKLTSYSCTLSTTDHTPPAAEIYLVTVNVGWIEDSEPKSVKMETLIYQNGLW